MKDGTPKTPGERLRQAREQAGFRSSRSAALRFGWIPSTYASHENGQTPRIPPAWATEYAKAFKVSYVWLLTGEQPGAESVQINGEVIGQGEVKLNTSGRVVYLPFAIFPGTLVLHVVSERMAPIYNKGDIVLCDDLSGVPDASDVIGFAARFTVGTAAQHKSYLTTLLPSSKRDHCRMAGIRCPPVRFDKIIDVAPVIALVPRSAVEILGPGVLKGRKRN